MCEHNVIMLLFTVHKLTKLAPKICLLIWSNFSYRTQLTLLFITKVTLDLQPNIERVGSLLLCKQNNSEQPVVIILPLSFSSVHLTIHLDKNKIV